MMLLKSTFATGALLGAFAPLPTDAPPRARVAIIETIAYPASGREMQRLQVVDTVSVSRAAKQMRALNGDELQAELLCVGREGERLKRCTLTESSPERDFHHHAIRFVQRHRVFGLPAGGPIPVRVAIRVKPTGSSVSRCLIWFCGVPTLPPPPSPNP